MKKNHIWTLATVSLVAIGASVFAQDEGSTVTHHTVDSESVYGW